MPRLISASRRWRSVAVVNPTMHWKRITVWLWWRICRSYEVLRYSCMCPESPEGIMDFAHQLMTVETCSLTDIWLLIVTPSTLREDTRDIVANGLGGWTWRLRLLSTKTISTVLVRLSVKLLAHAHVLMLFISAILVLTLFAGIMRYVSSAYLQNSLPGVIGKRSAALTT